MMLAL
jgi:hypothetical protein